MTRTATFVALPGPNRGGVACLLALLSILHAPAVSRSADRPVDGLIVGIPPVINSESTDRLRALLHGPLKRFDSGPARQGGRFVLVCDFNPEARTAGSDRFGYCLELARFLRSLATDHQGVLTVAYVHGPVRRHSVLPVLACSEIIFSEKGKLGPVVPTGGSLAGYESSAYQEITRNRFPAALVRKLYEPGVEVLRVGDRYVAADEKPRPQGVPVPELAAGDTVAYPFNLARNLGLCQQQPAATLEDVRTTYNVPRASTNRPLDRTACWRIPVEGAVTGELVEQTKRRVQRALRARVNLLIFELKCSGGDSDKAIELGNYIAELKERADDPVETVAYVTNQAGNLATFLAFGCNRIFMQSLPGEEGAQNEARLGDFGLYLQKRTPEQTRAVEESLSQSLTDLAAKQLYPTALAAGMFSRSLRIHAVEKAIGASGRAFLTEEEYRADQNGPRQWRSLFLVKPWRGQEQFDQAYLTLTARQAQELGVAHAVVKDFTQLCELEGLTSDQVRLAQADWLDGLADFLRDPWTSVVLVMLGITCLILELKMPGVGLPGVVSAICFVLFFWAHSQLHGQITWLAVLLFILGLLLIGLEIFVLPGLGVCGISGVLLVLTSLGLVAYGHWPRSSEEWVRFGHKISPFGISMLGALLAVVLIVRYLPHIPVLNRLISRPPEEDEDGLAEPLHPAHQELQALLGAIGVAATPLRPAGKTQFGDSFVDVVAEGGYIMPGTRVQVVEVEGNRVVVKEV